MYAGDRDEVLRVVQLCAGAVVAVAALVSLPSLFGVVASIGADAAGQDDSADPAASTVPAEPEPPMDWSWVKYVAIAAVVVALTAACVVMVRRSVRKSRAAAAVESELRAAQQQRWLKGVTVFREVALALTEAETDPYTIFVRPLLLDIDEPATAAFHAAFEAADTLHAETAPRDEALITEFVAAAKAARTAFDVADSTARRKMKSHITNGDRAMTPAEVRNLSRAENLLTLALDPGTSTKHADNLYAKVTEMIAGTVTIPAHIERRVRGRLDAIHRPALTAAVQ